MLILTRRHGEKIYIGDDICITITDVDRGSVKVGIEAPRDVSVLRGELRERMHAEDSRRSAQEANPAADGQPAPQADSSADRSFNEDATL